MIKNIIIKYREQISYLFFGVMTTLINFIAYFILAKAFGSNEYISNCIAWSISVIFAFITNKLFVFNSKSFNRKTIRKEIITFISARVASFGIDMLIMYIGIDLLLMNDIIVKLFSNIFVIAINYVLSKMVIFKKK